MTLICIYFIMLQTGLNFGERILMHSYAPDALYDLWQEQGQDNVFVLQTTHVLCLMFFLLLLSLTYLCYVDSAAKVLAADACEAAETDAADACEAAETDAADADADALLYEGQYFKQLEEMPETELSPEELAVISQHVLIETTPKGIVHMSYNDKTDMFDYYTDKYIDITYEILDTVARLFAITFRCKKVCVNYREELRKGEQKMLSEIEFDKLQKEIKERQLVNNKERSVFAAFKGYNKKNGNVVKKYYIMTEKANKFKYKGKILLKENTKEEEKTQVNISYNDFKMMQERDKNTSTTL